MKNLIFAFLGFTILFSACGKYEEGPSFSLASKKARVAGEWVYDKYIVNGTEQTIDASMASSVTTFKKDGTGSTTYTVGGITVTVEQEWKFNDDKTKFLSRQKNSVTGEWNEWSEGSEIIRLASKEFWLRDTETQGGITYTAESHFKAK